jgi:hypothetical protein
MTTTNETITQVATLDNAQAWLATSENFTFCLDLLELSLVDDGDAECDAAVDALEEKFENVLAADGALERTFSFQFLEDGAVLTASNGPIFLSFDVTHKGLQFDAGHSNVTKEWKHLPKIALHTARWNRRNK